MKESATGGPEAGAVAILVPVFNDWEAAELLLPKLDRAFEGRAGGPTRVILVNDGSTEAIPENFPRAALASLESIHVLHLRRNLGHQRAIAVGLSYIEEHVSCDAVVVMDADGSDQPEDAVRMLARLAHLKGSRVVFAERRRRSENLTFRFFYNFYRAIHYLLTGETVRVGNFSVVPGSLLSRMVVVSELWNHYAAAVFVSRIPYETLPAARAPRSTGESKMNFVRLVAHV